ncbi:MAG: peptidylprolyl isomerase [Candidatus Diapherotrites archaeon]
MAFKTGDLIKVNYTLKDREDVLDTTVENVAIKSGIFNSKKKYRPATVIIGKKNFFEKVDKEIETMNVGEKKVIELKPNDAFGDRSAELISIVALSEFKKRNIVPFPGLVVDVNGMQGRVQSVSGGRVRVDFNHPLAGKDLIFEVEVVEKIDDDKKKASALLERYFGDSSGAELSLSDKKLVVALDPTKVVVTDSQKKEFVDAAFSCIGIEEVNIVEKFFKEKKKS